MRINTEQEKQFPGGDTFLLPMNGDCTMAQVTLGGRDGGTVTISARPLLAKNRPDDFIADEFEAVEGGLIDLAAQPRKTTFTIEGKYLSALRFDDAGNGPFTVFVKQWRA